MSRVRISTPFFSPILAPNQRKGRVREIAWRSVLFALLALLPLVLAPSAHAQTLTRAQAVAALFDPGSGVAIDTTRSVVWSPYLDYGTGPGFEGLIPAGTIVDPLVIGTLPYPGPGISASTASYFFWIDDEDNLFHQHPTRFVLVRASDPTPTVGEGTIEVSIQGWYPVVKIPAAEPDTIFASLAQISSDSAPGPSNPQGLIAGSAYTTADLDSLPVLAALGSRPRGALRSGGLWTAGPDPRAAAILLRGPDSERQFMEYGLKEIHRRDLRENLGVDSTRMQLVAGGGVATSEQLGEAIEALGALVPPPDKIYLRIVAHGGKGTVKLGDWDLTVEDFNEIMQELGKFKVPVHLVLESCYGGSMLEQADRWGWPKGSTAVSSSSADSTSKGGIFYGKLGEWPFEKFAGGLFSLGMYEARKLAPPGADGIVDDAEAYAWLLQQMPIYTNRDGDEVSLVERGPRIYKFAGPAETKSKTKLATPSKPVTSDAPSGTRTFFLFQDACFQRPNGTWVPRVDPVTDSLNNYVPGTSGPYSRLDLSLSITTPGVGELWSIQSGNLFPTNDLCNPQKNAMLDRFFFGADPATRYTIPRQANAIETCTFPIPFSGTMSVRLEWSAYTNMPRGSGYVHYAEYRVFQDGAWQEWKSLPPRIGSTERWDDFSVELPDAAPAESIQVRLAMECLSRWASSSATCTPAEYGVLYDNIGIALWSGIAKPGFSIYPGSLPQSTFIDGTMHGLNCSTTPCWPGIRGTALGPPGIHDNVNSPVGDSLVVEVLSGRRARGMGVNWQYAFDGRVQNGNVIAHANGAYNPAYDTPRWIYRLFDPETKSWSPYDSSALDVDDLLISQQDTLVVGDSYRFNWPPRDKVASAASLPGGFAINGVTGYSGLAFLPRGTRLQYYFKAVDLTGQVRYQFSSDAPAMESRDLPMLPGGSVVAPDILEFDVLPGAYTPGPAGTLVEGATETPLLVVDGAYTSWSYAPDPIGQALAGLGVRADRYRTQPSIGTGSGIGGRSPAGLQDLGFRDYFPNADEYSLVDSLAKWYRLILHPSNRRGDWPSLEDQDARVLADWWERETGPDGGDRCIFAAGDDFFSTMLTPVSGFLNLNQERLCRETFGVDAAIRMWTGAPTTRYPSLDDRFAAPSAGPALGAPGSYVYPLDVGCPTNSLPDGLSKVASSDAVVATTYPVFASEAQPVAIARVSERDGATDHDRSKALGYGYSIQYVRQTGGVPSSANYRGVGVENRMRVLQKFLTGCRGARVSASDTSTCWPCPTDANLAGNWALHPGFQVSMYGPLYPIQDPGLITAVSGEERTPAVPTINALMQNRPNPFNPETIIAFSVASPGRLTVRVFDVAGRLVRTLTDRVYTPGKHEVRWSGDRDSGGPAASGIYFYQVVFPDRSKTSKRMTILR